MLILSRRENERILFPGLGISVQIVRASKRNVRLGVVAPSDVKVIREELRSGKPSDDSEGLSVHDHQSTQSESNGEFWLEGRDSGIEADGDPSNSSDRIQRIDDAILALRLAQNQLQQGRDEYAQRALEHASICLEECHDYSQLNSVPTAVVRQAKEAYSVVKQGSRRTSESSEVISVKLNPARWQQEAGPDEIIVDSEVLAAM